MIASLATVQVAGWCYLTLLSHGWWSAGFAYDVDNDAMPTWTYMLVQAGLCLSLIGTFAWMRHASVRHLGWVLLVVGAVLRLVALFGEPIHESDFYRYLWDGKVAKHGVNPYRFEPGALFLHEQGIEIEFPDQDSGVTWRGRTFEADETEVIGRLNALRDENPVLFDRVSHKAVTTIYPPVAQGIFHFSQMLFGDSVVGLKLLIVGFDMGVVFVILQILGRMGRPAAWAVLYAWNPLPIKEFANSAHYDPVAIFFVVLAVWLAMGEGSPGRRVLGAALALALGTLAKYFAILLLPVIVVAIHREGLAPASPGGTIGGRFWRAFYSREVWWGGGLFVIACVIGFAPYLCWDGGGAAAVFRGLRTYHEHWVYSPGLFALIEAGVGRFTDDPLPVSKWIALLLLGGVIVWVSLVSKRDLAARCFIVTAALFALTPTAFPWYFCWTLALIPFQERFSWLVLGALLPLNYLDFHSLGDTFLSQVRWSGAYATQVLIWGGFFVCWLAESLGRAWFRRRA